MSAMSNLNRRDELTVPSWPTLSTTTGIASATVGRHAANAGDERASVGPPSRMVSLSRSTPGEPMKILLEPAVTATFPPGSRGRCYCHRLVA